MKTPTTSLCRTVTDRLLEGDKLAGQPELAAHVGTCLDCFRTLTDLRELPRISEALRSDAALATFGEDPGPAFWNAMPKLIADQVLAAQKPVAPVRQTIARRWWAPATLMATGLAVAAVVLITDRPAVIENGTASRTVLDMAIRRVPVATNRTAVVSDEDLRALAEAGDDETEGAMEQVASLDGTELQRLTEALGQGLR